MGLRAAANEDTGQDQPLVDRPTVTQPDIPHISEESRDDTGPTGDGYPKRFWTAGPGTPQVKLVPVSTNLGGVGKKVIKGAKAMKPRNFYYVVENKEQEQFLRSSSMKNRVWEEDLEEDEPPLHCEECNFVCRSTRAMLAHNNTHKKGRSYLSQVRAVSPNAL